MDIDEVEKSLNRAIERLLQYDRYLLQHDLNERTISYRLGIYLQEEFPEWNVDCEYNRNFDDPKTLNLSPPPKRPTPEDTVARTVYPDIIVHRRGSNDHNLLVIEMKKSTNSDNPWFDYAKLEAFKTQMQYKFAIFLRFRISKRNPGVAKCEWIDD